MGQFRPLRTPLALLLLLAGCVPAIGSGHGDTPVGSDPDGVPTERPAIGTPADPDRTGGDRGDPLRIHFFDVGQGDAVLIQAPTGQNVLIDAGPGPGVVEHLLRLEVDTLHLVIASHNHADHIGGAAAVLRRFPVRLWMDNGMPHTTATYLRTLRALHELDVPLLEPEHRSVQLGDASLKILPPPGDPTLGHNDNSLGVVLRFGTFRATFAGDAEEHLWQFWLDSFPEAFEPVHVHKASHHGSRNGDLPAAMGRLRPALVVVSAGWGNRHGHPHPEALALYEAVGARVLSTGERGTVVVSAFRDGEFSVDPLPWTLEPSAAYHLLFGHVSWTLERKNR